MTTQNNQQATNQAQNAVSDQQTNAVEVPMQFKLNHFLNTLLGLNKNLIQVANINISHPQRFGEFVGEPTDFINAFNRSQATDLLFAYRTLDQFSSEISGRMTTITDPKAITDIRLAFAISNNLTVTAHYTLLEAKEAFDKHQSDLAEKKAATSNESVVNNES